MSIQGSNTSLVSSEPLPVYATTSERGDDSTRPGSDVMRSVGTVGYTHSQTETATRPLFTQSNEQRQPPQPQVTSLMCSMASFRNYEPPRDISAPSSQGSIASVASSGGAASAPSLPASSNNVSQITLDTDLTTPISPQSATDYTTSEDNLPAAKWTPPRKDRTLTSYKNGDRLRTPEDQTDASDQRRGFTSPMSMTTPTNGLKRSASGAIKSPEYNNMGSPVEMARPNRGRAESMSSTSSKASEVSTCTSRSQALSGRLDDEPRKEGGIVG